MGALLHPSGPPHGLEILAPAGNAEMLSAAVYSGADAVYLGFAGFNARRTAGNFDTETLAGAVAFCHARGVRVHAALNILVYDNELDNLARAIRCAAEAGMDALIVDDLADFTGEKGAFMSLSGDGTAPLIGLDGLVEGEVMPITVLDGSYSLDEMVQGVFSLALSGGSIHEGLVCVSNSISDEVIQYLGINSIIVFSRPEDGGSLFSFLSSQGLVWEGPYSAQALEFMLANEGPFLIVSSEEDGLLCLPTVLACLMGSRASQIVDDYASALSLTAGQTRALSAQVDELLSLLNGGTLPSDASLLSMSTNHLNRDLGLSFDTIPSLRLHLR